MPLSRMSAFFKRQSVLPFETVFGFFCIYSGIVGFFSLGIANDIFRRVLGGLADVFNVAYVFAGFCVFFGIGWNKRNLEAVGWIIVIMSLIVRSIAIYFFAGLSGPIFNNYVFTAAFAVACIVRLHGLIRGVIIISSENIRLKP